jgi:hypothetical protein
LPAWTSTQYTVDMPTPSQLVADDWISGSPDKPVTKAGFLDAMESGKHELEPCEFGPRDVEVLGNNAAVLHGSIAETRTIEGQRTTFRVSYMDVWVKRGDRWMVLPLVRRQAVSGDHHDQRGAERDQRRNTVAPAKRASSPS